MNRSDEHPAAGERIAKVIARAGLASRREAEAWIAAGRVAVNGEPIASPARNVTTADRVTVDGEPLPVRERTRLFLYHKPRGLLTTHADPGGRPTIFSVLPKGLPRLISVGRLDVNTEGLLLLTNDGGLARTLELPATGWLRRYRVRAHGRVTQAELDRLRAGVTIDGIRYGSVEATVDRVQGSNVWLTFAIREGKNREVRNVLGHLGLAVNRLIRVSFGPFQLGELAVGAIEEVRTRTLREQLGARVAAQAGADFAGPRIEREAQPGEGQGARKSPKPVVPAKAGTHRGPHRGLWNMGPRHGVPATQASRGAPRGDDNTGRKLASSQDDGERNRPPQTQTAKRKRRRGDPDRIGQPELARREKRRGRRSARDKRR
jgi:23S rRNA pseudouridine2605 synthase